MGMPQDSLSLPCRISKQFDLSLQLSYFLALLINNECLTPKIILYHMGTVDARVLVHRLRRSLENAGVPVTIRSRRSLGYWLDDDTRLDLTRQLDVRREATYARLSCGTDDWRSAF
jgi:hypothetical protein